MIAVYDLAALIHRNATVRIAVKGKSNVQLLLLNELTQALDMRRSRMAVDVHSVRRGIDGMGPGSQGVEYAFGDHPGTSVCTVQADAKSLKGKP